MPPASNKLVGYSHQSILESARLPDCKLYSLNFVWNALRDPLRFLATADLNVVSVCGRYCWPTPTICERQRATFGLLFFFFFHRFSSLKKISTMNPKL